MIMVKSSHFGRAGLGEEFIGSVQVKKKKEKIDKGLIPGYAIFWGNSCSFPVELGMS